MRLNSYVSQFYNKAAENPRKYIFIPLLVYWVLLFILTSIPSKSLPALGTSDKVKHFGAYLILTVLFRLSVHFYRKLKRTDLNELLISVSIIALYSIFDEIHQYFIPGRYFDWFDLLANLIGLSIGIILGGYVINSGSVNKN